MSTKSKVKSQASSGWETGKLGAGSAHEHRSEQRGVAGRNNEDPLSALMADLPVGLYRRRLGEHGRFVAANQMLAKMLGYETVEAFLKIEISVTLAESTFTRYLFSFATGTLVRCMA